MPHARKGIRDEVIARMQTLTSLGDPDRVLTNPGLTINAESAPGDEHVPSCTVWFEDEPAVHDGNAEDDPEDDVLARTIQLRLTVVANTLDAIDSLCEEVEVAMAAKASGKWAFAGAIPQATSFTDPIEQGTNLYWATLHYSVDYKTTRKRPHLVVDQN